MEDKGLGPILSLVMQGGALLLFLRALPWAGGLVGGVYNAATQRSKQGAEFLKGNVNDPHSLRNRVKRNFSEQTTRGQMRAIQAGDNVNASRRAKLRGRFASAIGGNVDQRFSSYNKMAGERRDMLSGTGDDKLLYAAGGYTLSKGERMKEYMKVTNADTGEAMSVESALKQGANVVGAEIKADEAGNSYMVNTKDTRYMSSKGDEIGEMEYKRGKRLYGNTSSELGNALEYRLRKAQNADDVANFREAFARNAVAQQWNEDETMGAWATATYPHKDKWASEWYSTPKITDEQGRDTKDRKKAGITAPITHTSGVKFRDVGQDESSYKKMVSELHTTRENFRMGSVRAEDWQAMYDHQIGVQNKLDAGTATPDEKESFVKTSEILDAVTHQGYAQIQQGDNGVEVTVTGAGPASAGKIEALYKSRRYATASAEGVDDSGQRVYSPTDRVIYDKAATDRVVAEAAKRGQAPPNKDALIRTPAYVKDTVRVSQSREAVPVLVQRNYDQTPRTPPSTP